MKKDLLLGLSGKWSVIVGIVFYSLSRIVAGETLFLIVATAMLEISGLWFFFGGIYRWYREIRDVNKKDNHEQN